MTEKKVPFTTEQIKDIIRKYPTPFHIYDEKAIRENARRFYKAFSWVPGGFKDYFAVKALPNPYIMKILKEYSKERLVIVVTHDRTVLTDVDTMIEMWDGNISSISGRER